METIYLDSPEAVLGQDYILDFAIPRLCRPDADPRVGFHSGSPEDPLVTFPYLDLKAYCAVLVGRITYLVTEHVLALSGLTAEEVMEAAFHNSFERAVVHPLSELLHPGISSEDPPYVFTTQTGLYGAPAGLFHTDLLYSLAKKLGTKYLFLLPSSVHEIIVLPGSPEEKEGLDALVAAVNREEVDENEQLADHCYLFDADTGEISF